MAKHAEKGTLMAGVTEHAEGYEVRLVETNGAYTSSIPDDQRPGRGRLVISALNQGGHDGTEVDLLQVLAWVKANRPDLLA